MNRLKTPPIGLAAIVFYKAFSASLLAMTSVALLLALKNREGLEYFSNEYVLRGKIEIIKWLLEKFVNLNPRTIEFSGIAAGVYAAVSAIEAIGLWYQKTWAMLLVVGLVGISIPAEIYELIRGASPVKISVFLVNVVVFGYLLHHWLKSRKTEQAS